MPVRMLNFLTKPIPAGAWASSPIKETQEWKEVLAALHAELKPHEYLAIEFPEGHSIYTKVKHPMLAMWHQAKREVGSLGLPYNVVIRGRAVYIVGKSDRS